MFTSVGNALLLAFGFGFVIFWHELGHFLAAKWAGVRVEQFAVGFGQALVCWRKGLGFRIGTSAPEYERQLEADREAGRATAIGETEYRLNWIPLGGYVKMLGQDDLKPGAVADDPRSYNNKPVGKRMVIVSAGVVMNVILAGIGFMVWFMIGPTVTPAVVGSVQPGSPAQRAYVVAKDGHHEPAGLEPGDAILTLNGRWQSDFDKLRLNTALLIPGEPVSMQVRRRDGQTQELTLVPQKADAKGEFPLLGIAPAPTLNGPPADAIDPPTEGAAESPDEKIIGKGDRITAINGQPVGPSDGMTDGWRLTRAIQASDGKPVRVTIHNAATGDRPASLPVTFQAPFDDGPVNFGGLEMLPSIDMVQADSAAKKVLLPGDVILSVADAGPGGDRESFDTQLGLRAFLKEAGKAGSAVTLRVLREGKEVATDPIVPNVKLADGNRGLGIGLRLAAGMSPVVVAAPSDGSPAAAAGVPKGSKIVSVDGAKVATWFDLWRAFKTAKADQPIAIVAVPPGAGAERTYTLKPLSAEAVATIQSYELASFATAGLTPQTAVLKQRNPLTAAWSGAGETRDAIVQVYLTVRSMAKGSISAKQISGPVGILSAGYHIAGLGYMKLLWFLSIISANLAVMNFLPIPIVDGGLFTFLIAEKVKGRPISERTQQVAQVVGLVILLSVFVFATFQDINRML